MVHAVGMMGSLARNRELILEMTRREILSGQSNTFLGQIWFFLNPVLTILLYVLVFGFVFRVRLGDAPEGVGIAYLMCGIVAWLTISDIIMRSAQVVRSNANLVQQIVFPIEVLVAKTVLASFSVLAILLTCLLVFLGLSDAGLSWIQLALVPGAIVLLFIFTLGLALLIGSLTPFLPDLAEVIGIISRIGLFMAPILYTPGMFADRWWNLFYYNPFSYFIWVFQDAFAFQSVEHLYAWIAAGALALMTFVAGASVFRRVSHGFGDVI
jgi:lipopolysaccharide transport system permease protein